MVQKKIEEILAAEFGDEEDEYESDDSQDETSARAEEEELGVVVPEMPSG
ncbi:MAG: hypothetical protein AAF206_23290 [Bacteroidota bacterium]